MDYGFTKETLGYLAETVDDAAGYLRGPARASLQRLAELLQEAAEGETVHIIPDAEG